MDLALLKWVSLLIGAIGFYVAGLINRKTKLALIPILLIGLVIFIPLKQLYFPFFILIILFSVVSLLLSRRELDKKFKIPTLLILIVVFVYYLFSQPLIVKNKGFAYNTNNDFYNATVLWDFSDNTPSVLPDETFQDIDGNKVSLRSFEGKKIYITFWATWCGPCLGQKPSLEKLKETYKNDTNIVFVDISIDSDTKRWKNYIAKENPMGIQLVSSNEALTRSNFKFSGIPYEIVANSAGFYKKHMGPHFLDHGLLTNTDSLNEYINTPYMVFKTSEVDGEQMIMRVR